MYTTRITYPVYDLNSSEFVTLIKNVLQAEFTEQIASHGKSFLPTVVKADEYLVDKIMDSEINPAFCSIIKAKSAGTDQRFGNQDNNENLFVIQILAKGLSNLRNISDAIYEILNDMDVKDYIFKYRNALNQQIISDSGKYFVSSTVFEFDVKKTINDKDIINGHLVLNAEIAEIPKENQHGALDGANVDHKLGENEINITQEI